MAFETLLVHVAPSNSNTALLKIAGELADRFQWNVLGVAICHPSDFGSSGLETHGEVNQKDRDAMTKELKQAEAEFRSALGARAVTLDWRAHISYDAIANLVAAESRGADILITNPSSDSPSDQSRREDTGDLVIKAGRPVIVAPEFVDKLGFEHVVVAWKETREARRALLDSLLMLKQATHVSVVAIAAEKNLAAVKAQMQDVSAWLKRHGVTAESIASVTTGDDVASLKAICLEQKADLIVAGAYGHSQIRERAVGGVTRDLLLKANCCTLISH